MSTLFASGLIIDLILAGMLLEGALLLYFSRSGRRWTDRMSILLNLLSGAALLLALRAALVGAAWPWIALWLLAALVAHAADTIRRMR